METDGPCETIDPIDPVVPDDVLGASTVLDRRRLAWARQTLQDAERHATPCGTFRESKRPQRFLGSFTLMSHILDS